MPLKNMRKLNEKEREREGEGDRGRGGRRKWGWGRGKTLKDVKFHKCYFVIISLSTENIHQAAKIRSRVEVDRIGKIDFWKLYK